jgi:serine/threonine protein kinase/tetratricopeptide (TPR) repeat protein
MATDQLSPSWQDVDVFVEAFERSRSVGPADIAAHQPPPGHPCYLSVLRELVRVDLEYGWESGRGRRVEDYLAEFPVLRTDREGLQAITFEEYRLRRRAGQEPSPAEYHRRFGVDTFDWPVPLPGPATDGPAAATTDPESALRSVPGGAAYAELIRELQGADPGAAQRLARALMALPTEGFHVPGFRLLRELGRGAFARVYLARQEDLAQRLVALKVAIDLRGESQTLAQLQHTNIVPVYSVHSDPPFQVLCMPYFGGTTLADARSELAKLPRQPESGRWLVEVLAARAAESGAAADGTLTMLSRMRYVDAVLWLGARLAEALAHAHERGILHGDLKPANVLLSDEGRPMLLDFNLAADAGLRGRAAAAMVGGTLPYMAPEQLAAFRDGRHRADARGDVYALGLILFEMLGGGYPFPLRRGPVAGLLDPMIADREAAPPDVRRRNPAVSPAGASILRRCLEPDPARRYPSARALREDLERQLANLPLKHAPEPSWLERGRKWVRRHPRLTSIYAVGTVAVALLVLLGSLYVWRGRQLVREQAGHAYHHFAEELRTSEFLLGSPGPDPNDLREGVALAEATLGRYRVLDDPNWRATPYVTGLDADERLQLPARVRELLLFLALGLRQQAHDTAEPARRDQLLAHALDMNALAETCDDSDENLLAVTAERSCLLHDAGRAAEVQEADEKVRSLSPRTALDLLVLAIDRLEKHEYAVAGDLLQQAQHKDPQNPFLWYGLGVSATGRGDYREAKACFSTSIALWPHFHGSYYQRGVASARLASYQQAVADFDEAVRLRPAFAPAYYERARAQFELQDYARAVADFDEAIRLDSGFLPAYVDRALSRYRLNDLAGAQADLTYALDHGIPQTRVYHMRSLVGARLGNREGAAADREELLRREPADELSWIARGIARLDADPPGALADFEEALRLNPRSLAALEDKAHVLAERMGQTKEAVTVLDEVLALYPDRVQALASRGVLLARLGRRDMARADARDALRLDNRPATLYQVAGVYALTSKAHPEDLAEAFRLLDAALRQGYGFDLVATDPDLKPIRDLPEFRRLVEEARAAQTGPPPQPPAGK